MRRAHLAVILALALLAPATLAHAFTDVDEQAFEELCRGWLATQESNTSGQGNTTDAPAEDGNSSAGSTPGNGSNTTAYTASAAEASPPQDPGAAVEGAVSNMARALDRMVGSLAGVLEGLMPVATARAAPANGTAEEPEDAGTAERITTFCNGLLGREPWPSEERPCQIVVVVKGDNNTVNVTCEDRVTYVNGSNQTVG